MDDKPEHTNLYRSHETHESSSKRRFWRSLDEMKQKYRLNLIFDVINLILSIVGCLLYIISTYQACNYHGSRFYLLFNIIIRIYFLIDFSLNMLTSKKAKWSFEDFTYILSEIGTIMPYILIRLIISFEEDYTSFWYLISNASISFRISRLEYLSKYFVS